MTKHAVEARVHRRLDNAGGVFVTFQIHTDDTKAVDGVRVGDTVMLAWEDIVNTKVEKIELSGNRAAQGGISATVANRAETPRETSKPRRKFEELSPSQQAGMRCNNQEFRTFLECKGGRVIGNPDMAAEAVRAFCGISSRIELDDEGHDNARNKWKMLNAEFAAWSFDQRYRESIHR